tara:strand:+ start:1958 stop:2167 length:210 start_codon:yes stop_codon:yes gene_type:complete
MVAGPRKGKMKASKKAKTIASGLREISPGVMVNKNYKPGKNPALDKVLKDLKGDPTKLDSSGMGTHYKI